jgi:hypothetical protein
MEPPVQCCSPFLTPATGFDPDEMGGASDGIAQTHFLLDQKSGQTNAMGFLSALALLFSIILGFLHVLFVLFPPATWTMTFRDTPPPHSVTAERWPLAAEIRLVESTVEPQPHWLQEIPTTARRLLRSRTPPPRWCRWPSSQPR